jgi:carbon monoxide dehydrogenase subunit G
MSREAITFGGEEHFAATPERVFALLTDLDALARLMPDLVSAKRIDDRTLECVVRPGVSFLRGTLRLNIRLVDLKAPESAAMHMSAQGIGTKIGVESTLSLRSEPAGTRLEWSSKVVELSGLVATISRGLIVAAAGQQIREMWQRIQAELANEQSGESPANTPE